MEDAIYMFWTNLKNKEKTIKKKQEIQFDLINPVKILKILNRFFIKKSRLHLFILLF